MTGVQTCALPIYAGKHEIDVGERHAVAPHFIFRAVGVGIFQPLDDLVPALGSGGLPHGSISDAHTGVIPESKPPNGKPPEPSKRLPRVSLL